VRPKICILLRKISDLELWICEIGNQEFDIGDLSAVKVDLLAKKQINAKRSDNIGSLDADWTTFEEFLQK
jgi:hypothetical protein